MIDNEVKSILEQQFSIEKNYERIIRKTEKNKKSYGILKYALIPICLIILVIIVISKENQNSEKVIRQVIEFGIREEEFYDELLDRTFQSELDKETPKSENIVIIKIKIIETNKKAEIIENIKGKIIDENKVYLEDFRLEEGKEYVIYIDTENYNIIKIIE